MNSRSPNTHERNPDSWGSHKHWKKQDLFLPFTELSYLQDLADRMSSFQSNKNRRISGPDYIKGKDPDDFLNKTITRAVAAALNGRSHDSGLQLQASNQARNQRWAQVTQKLKKMNQDYERKENLSKPAAAVGGQTLKSLRAFSQPLQQKQISAAEKKISSPPVLVNQHPTFRKLQSENAQLKNQLKQTSVHMMPKKFSAPKSKGNHSGGSSSNRMSSSMPTYPTGTMVSNPGITEKTSTNGQRMVIRDTNFVGTISTPSYAVPAQQTIIWSQRLDPNFFSVDAIAAQDFDRYVYWRLKSLHFKFETNVPTVGRGRFYLFYDPDPESTYPLGTTVAYNTVKNNNNIYEFSISENMDCPIRLSNKNEWLFVDSNLSVLDVPDNRLTSCGQLVLVYFSGLDTATAAVDLANLFVTFKVELQGRHFDQSLSTKLQSYLVCNPPYCVNWQVGTYPSTAGEAITGGNSTNTNLYSLASLLASYQTSRFAGGTSGGGIQLTTSWAATSVSSAEYTCGYIQNTNNTCYFDHFADPKFLVANPYYANSASAFMSNYFQLPPGDWSFDFYLGSIGNSTYNAGNISGLVVEIYTPDNISSTDVENAVSTIDLIGYSAYGANNNVQFPVPPLGWNQTSLGFSLSDPNSGGGVLPTQFYRIAGKIRIRDFSKTYTSNHIGQYNNMAFFDVVLNSRTLNTGVYPINLLIANFSRIDNGSKQAIACLNPDVNYGEAYLIRNHQKHCLKPLLQSLQSKQDEEKKEDSIVVSEPPSPGSPTPLPNIGLSASKLELLTNAAQALSSIVSKK